MPVIQSLAEIPPDLQNQILLIGNFDGLHKGHQKLITRAEEIAKQAGKKAVLLTFEPHPRKLFRPDDPPFRLTPFDLKITKLKEFGIDHVVSLPFDWEFASQTAESFVDNILKEHLDASHVVVGEDFCFGQLRKGTPETIRSAGIDVTTLSPENDPEGHKYSSSNIRQALRQGQITEANAMLGWEWHMEGIVVEGDKRGRELGYPTANVPLGSTMHPAYGIYACYVQIEGEDEWHPAAVNIGIRPMFELQEGQVEAHILKGFDRDIYGKNLHVKPVKRLRGEAKFDSLEELCLQMEKDCTEALVILG